MFFGSSKIAHGDGGKFRKLGMLWGSTSNGSVVWEGASLVWSLASFLALVPRFESHVIHIVTSFDATKVSSILVSGEWKWSSTRSKVVQIIIGAVVQVRLYDSYWIVWSPSKARVYSCKSTWELFKACSQNVHWYKLVWDGQ